jgi:hypothetical protein
MEGYANSSITDDMITELFLEFSERTVRATLLAKVRSILRRISAKIFGLKLVREIQILYISKSK